MRRIALSTALLTAGCSLLQAEPTAIDQARKALSERIPQVAVFKVRRFLETPKLSQEEQNAAYHLLSEALLSAGQVEEAAEVVRKLPAGPENAVLRGNIHAALGQWEDALRIYREGSGIQAQVGEVEALHARGRDLEAVALLEKLVGAGAGGNSLRLRLASLLTEVNRIPEAQTIINKLRPISPEERRWKLYVEARILLAEGYADSARRGFEQILADRDGLSDSLLFGATLGLTEAVIVLKGHDEADKELETFIWRYPQSAFLNRAFQRLDQIYQEQEDPQEEQLHKWAQKPEAERAALALFYVCRLQMRARKYDKAATSLEYFVKSFSSHPLVCEVHLMQADLHLALNQFPLAVGALEAAMRQVKSDELRAEIELRTGLAHFQQGEYLLAANLFRTAADGSERLRSVATFNAALAWLNQGNEDRFEQEVSRLGDTPREQRLKSDLLLEQGLLQARQSDLRAEESLQLFLRKFPRHSREAEARLALAEIAFWKLRASAVPPSGGAEHAEQLLRVANAAPQTPQTEENAEYLAIFVADARQPRDDAEVVRLAKNFLATRPDSALAPDVQMKLGQVYYQQKDFANAETQFVQLTEKSPKSAYAESALFLAGQCAMELRAEDRALAYFKNVVDRNGPLKLYARQEQAVTQSRLGEEAEAVRLYDVILAADPDPELYAASLCGKGDNLATLGKKQPARLKEAVEVYQQLATAPAVSVVWRNQALYKKAKSLEALGRKQEAINTFYEVLEKSASGTREYFWTYKAGLDAGEIFEKDQQWTSAIGVYEKLARLGGPRADEVKERIQRLELKHFIMD